MLKLLSRSFLIGCLLLTLVSCITPQVIYRDIDSKTQVVMDKDLVIKMMEQTIRLKSELMECLERERK